MSQPLIRKLLIANRGEIACRIIRTAHAMGISTVAVYSEADAEALHSLLADEAVCIGPAAAASSYLNQSVILQACRDSGADAVHPGYGFLSESAAFAEAVQQAGLIFVGPDPTSIKALGNKSAGKQLAASVGVPCLPGYNQADQRLATLLEQARSIGAPLMIKAASGGGGRGMRRIDALDDTVALTEAIESAAREAQASFGDPTLLMERLLENARHIEVQIFGDRFGQVVYLGERDCSTQRRNQKIIEEAPAPGLSEQTRRNMGEAAVALAKAVQYVGAGTIEFLMAEDQSFYFLEMNTRLQVEHPVTEAVTGLDLVRWQLQVAQGYPLPLDQSAITSNGHAIEVRLCAEDPFEGFQPQAGMIGAWDVPADVRFDHGLGPRAQVPAFYDSMIGKLIVHASTRTETIKKLSHALEGSFVLGLPTNRDFLQHCLADACFLQAGLPAADNAYSTGWLTRQMVRWERGAPSNAWLALAAAVHYQLVSNKTFGALGHFRSTAPYPVTWPLRLADIQVAAKIAVQPDHHIHVQIGEQRFDLGIGPLSETRFHFIIDGKAHKAACWLDGHTLWLDAFGRTDRVLSTRDLPPLRKGADTALNAVSTMHGLVTRVQIVSGQAVEAGQLLLSIEAMKMEHRIEAPRNTIIKEILVQAGQQVTPGQLLLAFSPPESIVPL